MLTTISCNIFKCHAVFKCVSSVPSVTSVFSAFKKLQQILPCAVLKETESDSSFCSIDIIFLPNLMAEIWKCIVTSPHWGLQIVEQARYTMHVR